MADLFWPMAMSIKELGSTIKRMGKVNIITLKELHTREAGSRISSKVEAKRNGQMAHSTMATTCVVKSMAVASFSGQMGQNTKVNGRTIRCTAKESSSGLTVESIKESTSTTRSMAKAFTHGQTQGCTKEGFITESSMERGFIGKLMDKRFTVYGKRVRKAKFVRAMKNFKVYPTMFDCILI